MFLWAVCVCARVYVPFVPSINGAHCRDKGFCRSVFIASGGSGGFRKFGKENVGLFSHVQAVTLRWSILAVSGTFSGGIPAGPRDFNGESFVLFYTWILHINSLGEYGAACLCVGVVVVLVVVCRVCVPFVPSINGAHCSDKGFCRSVFIASGGVGGFRKFGKENVGLFSHFHTFTLRWSRLAGLGSISGGVPGSPRKFNGRSFVLFYKWILWLNPLVESGALGRCVGVVRGVMCTAR